MKILLNHLDAQRAGGIYGEKSVSEIVLHHIWSVQICYGVTGERRRNLKELRTNEHFNQLP